MCGVSVVVWGLVGVFFLMIRRPPRSTQSRSSAASDVYKRQGFAGLPRGCRRYLQKGFMRKRARVKAR